MSAAMGPIFGMLKTIVAGFALIVVAYIVGLAVLKGRINEPRRFRLWRDGLHLVAIVLMALWVWFVATR